MRRFLIIGVLTFLSLSSTTAVAKHEIILGAGSLSLGSAVSKIDMSTGYNFEWKSWLQLGGNLRFFRQTHDTVTVSLFDIFAGPTLNIGGNVVDAFYLSFFMMLRTGSSTPESTTSPSGFGIAMFFGKRFEVFSNMTFRPSIGFGTAGGTSFELTPFQFSYHF